VPSPERVRRWMWALRVAESEVDWTYSYSDAQRVRVLRNVKDRARWLALRGPYVPPRSKELIASRERFLRGSCDRGPAARVEPTESGNQGVPKSGTGCLAGPSRRRTRGSAAGECSAGRAQASYTFVANCATLLLALDLAR
jgi:hypothetical protein